MKGFWYIIIIYFSVLLLSAGAKILLSYYKKIKKSENPPAPKIYYVSNTPKKPLKRTPKIDIAIKGRIVEKDKIN
ncbi:MAG: hypothetical protein J6Q38_02115 [Clostridia bacterium]|nr:hypothetical protein [Clostridia bacterium]